MTSEDTPTRCCALAADRLGDWKAERERRIRAEQERDEALAGVRVLARENIECHERVVAICGHPNHGEQNHDCAPFLHAAESRPLTADDITDEMIERARKAWNRSAALGSDLWRDVLTAALTPTRPEGAEKVEAVLHQYWSGDINGDDLANRIAEEMNR